MNTDKDFSLFRTLHNKIAPHAAWTAIMNYPGYAQYLLTLCTFIRETSGTNLCHTCENVSSDLLRHILFSCDTTSELRDELWCALTDIDIELSVIVAQPVRN